jgi:hypothetical protein
VLLVCLIAEWLLLTRAASFAGVLGFGGVIANSLTAGIFPALLLFASRRKGDYVPRVVYRLLGQPAFTTTVCLLALANLLVHGVFIYRDPWLRGSAVGVALLVVGIVATMLRRGVFARRSVVELREDTREGATIVLSITSAGQPLNASVRIGHAAGEEIVDGALASVPPVSKLRSIVLRLPPGDARELKVWTHRVTPDGISEPLPAVVEIRGEGQMKRFDLKLSGGQVVVPLTGGGCRIEMAFPENELPPAADTGDLRGRGVTGAKGPS